MAEVEKTGVGFASGRVAWHSFPLGDVFAHLGSKRGGLTSEETENRLKHFGRNVSPGLKKKGKMAGEVFLRQLFGPMALALWALLFGEVIKENYTEALVVLAALVLVAIFSFLWDGMLRWYVDKSAVAHLESKVLAKRDGFPKSVNIEEIVPGDVLLLRMGDVVPADARVISSWGLEVDESAVTGKKGQSKLASTVPAGTAVSDRTNILFAGSLVTTGSGEVIVVETAGNVEVAAGSILKTKRRTPDVSFLKARVKRFVWFSVGSGLVFFAAALGWNYFFSRFGGLIDSPAVFLIVFLPFSLPLTAFWLEKMAMETAGKEYGLVKSAYSFETLGACGVAVFGQSGVLTKGEPELVKVLTPERVSGVFEFNSLPKSGSNHILVLSYALLAAGVSVEGINNELDEHALHGCPTGRAIAKAGFAAGLDLEKLDRKFKRVNEISFNHKRSFGVSFRENREGEVWALFLGLPDILLSRVRRLQIINRAENLIPLEQTEIREDIEGLCRRGFEVMALCAKKIENRNSIEGRLSEEQLREVATDLTLVGLLVFRDSLRPETSEAMRLAWRAGVKTILLAQGHPLMAMALAREVGLLPRSKTLPEIMEGKDIESMDERELSHCLINVGVFGHINLEHKLEILRTWQTQGEVVVVVGDSVEDSSLLSQAGVAAALAGSPASVVASAGVVLKNGLFSLVGMIRESRVFAARVRKIVSVLLAFSWIDCVFLVASSVFGYGTGFGSVQVLFLNFVPLGLAVLALGVSRGLESDFTPSAPNDAKRPFLERQSVFFASCWGVVGGIAMFVLFYFFRTYFESVLYARSVAFAFGGVLTAAVAFSAGGGSQILNVKFHRPASWLLFLGLAVASVVAVVYVPVVNSFFGVQPVGLLEWVVMLCAGAICFVVIESAKWVFGLGRKRRSAR